MSVTIEKAERGVARGVLEASYEPFLPSKPESAPRWGVIGLVGLRLAIGFEFLWAFFDAADRQDERLAALGVGRCHPGRTTGATWGRLPVVPTFCLYTAWRGLEGERCA
jgi:hypothetical protein